MSLMYKNASPVYNLTKNDLKPKNVGRLTKYLVRDTAGFGVLFSWFNGSIVLYVTCANAQ